MGRKITVLTGSPHLNGTSSKLADVFVSGISNTNDVYRFDAGLSATQIDFLKLDENESTIHDNDIVTQEVMPHIINSDVLILCSSLYYYGINAELKTIIDRFYEYNQELKGGKDVYILITGYDGGDQKSSTYRPLVEYFNQLCKYMRWDIKGEVLGSDSWNDRKLRKRVSEAIDLGKKIS